MGWRWSIHRSLAVARAAPVTVNPSGTVTRSELGFDTEPTGELFVTFAWKTTLVLAAAVVGLVIASAIVLWLGSRQPRYRRGHEQSGDRETADPETLLRDETVRHPIPPRYVDIRLATRVGRMA